MLYKKAKDLTFVDMCIWIDENVYKEHLSSQQQEKIYEYLYHITKMLAYKAHLFNKGFYYEDFAIYSATRTYLRLTNPKQFELDSKGNFKLKKIKSVLNYIKSVLYPHKVDFEQEFYSQVIDYSSDKNNLIEVSNYTFSDMLHEYTDDLYELEFNLSLDTIPKIIKDFLNTIPYKKSSPQWHNIYISCLLTLINYCTLSKADKKRINEIKMSDNYRLKYIEKAYKQQVLLDPILFHLDSSLKSYVKVLVNTIKHIISKQLTYETHIYIPSNSNSMILAEINSEEYEYE